VRSAQKASARGLANAFLAGEWERPELLARGSEAAGASGRWLRQLVQDVLVAFPTPPRDARDALAALILQHEGFLEIWGQRWNGWRLRRWYVDTPEMRRPAPWPVKPLGTLRDVAVWLGLTDEQLEWLADRKGFERSSRAGPLQNYTYACVPKQSGGLRVLEAPKGRLKRIQRKILAEILDRVPPHEAAHGFRRGRSALTHARLHVGKAVVIRWDLRDFFSSVHPARAHGVFRAAGYPEQVARTLLGLCTNLTPRAVLAKLGQPKSAQEVVALFDLRRSLAAPHLPQGAPTSPALANLVAFGLDVRLTAVAAAYGATYSRYADDLTFSGGSELSAARLQRVVREVVRDEGFALNDGKTRVMDASRRQEVTGIVVNRAPGVPREEFDELKATLHNFGQERRAPKASGRSLPGAWPGSSRSIPPAAPSCARCSSAWSGLAQANVRASRFFAYWVE
jgi:hypothetical protein